MTPRDDRGGIIYSACRELRTCNNTVRAELSACKEGLELALHRTELPITVELDCTKGGGGDHTTFRGPINAS